MSFNSLPFLIFLPVVVICYWLLPFKFRKYFLLLASYFCYAYFSIWLLLLMIGITSISYVASLLISKESISFKLKKTILISSIVLVLSFLFVFKYLNFVWSNISNIFNAFGIKLNPTTLNIILPIGISFYTFQTLSYVVDVYKGTFKAEKDFIYFSLFVSFFPQLVAGPIERPSDLLPQFKKESSFSNEFLFDGVQKLIIGYIKKIVIADVIAIFVDSVYKDLAASSGLMILLASALFYFQIYADFSGYSDIAKGSASLLGIKLTNNFDEPYKATSIKDFWKRRHITLTNRLTDYVYIPLGGNRKGEIRKYLNIFIVFFISGLWHGANWTFLIRGVANGVLLILHNIFESHFTRYKNMINSNSKITKICLTTLTFITVSLLWILFRCQSVNEIGIAFTKIFTSFINWTSCDIFKNTFLVIFIILGIVLILNISKLPKLYDSTLSNDINTISSNCLIYFALVILIGLTWIYLLETKGESGFIYFQF